MKNVRALRMLLLSLCLIQPGGVPLKAQVGPVEKAQWLAANGVPLRSADPGDADFSDLMPIRRSSATPGSSFSANRATGTERRS